MVALMFTRYWNLMLHKNLQLPQGAFVIIMTLSS